LPAGASLLANEGCGEVQTPVNYSGPEILALGDPIFFRHAKAGELCEHFNEIVLLAGAAVVGRVPTYRGDGRSFV
jgi:D-serine deaminase-like pyridoxal phosphate-dependent protein